MGLPMRPASGIAGGSRVVTPTGGWRIARIQLPAVGPEGRDMSEVGFIIREIAEVSDRLLAVPADDLGTRRLLLYRRDELTDRAARQADNSDRYRSTDQLLTELVILRRQRDAMLRQYTDCAHPASRLQRDREPAGTVRINHRIGQITGILADRGVDAG